MEQSRVPGETSLRTSEAGVLSGLLSGMDKPQPMLASPGTVLGFGPTSAPSPVDTKPIITSPLTTTPPVLIPSLPPGTAQTDW